MSVFELLGFRNEDARRALARFGVDYDELEAAVASKNKADLRLARGRRQGNNSSAALKSEPRNRRSDGGAQVGSDR